MASKIKTYLEDRAPLGVIVAAVTTILVAALHVGGAIFIN